MSSRSILPDWLSYLHRRKGANQVRPYEKTNQEGHKTRYGCTKGDIAEDIEDGIGGVKRIEIMV
jgi:hypothetical protein